MADLLVKKIRTEKGDASIDYTSLANKPTSDATLTVSGGFADAKAVKDAINSLNTQLSGKITTVQTSVTTLETNVQNKGYVTSAQLDAKGYVTSTQLDGKGYVTESSLQQQGYIKTLPTASYSTAGIVKLGSDFTTLSDGALSLNSGAVAWDDVTNKPSIATANHTHTLENLTNVEVCQSTPSSIVNGKWYLVKAEV